MDEIYSELLDPDERDTAPDDTEELDDSGDNPQEGEDNG